MPFFVVTHRRLFPDRVERAKASLLAETRLHDELQRRREKRGLRRLDDWIRVQTDADASFLQKL